MLNMPPAGSQHLLEYNILLLGETQSGKSTLIQYMTRYADPDKPIDIKALGTGFLSYTMEVKTEAITSDLPEHSVINENGGTINHRDFLAMPDENDYEDALNLRYGLRSQKGDPHLPKPARFNLIDTPGMNATGGGDEKHVQKIFHGLMEARTIHLLLITIPSRPFTQGLQDAIRYYVDMFPGFRGIMAFVHTRFDYKHFHPACAQESRAIDLKSENLHKILGRASFPHFKIDCSVQNKRPIRECITLNTIQKILELATFNRPVDMLHTVLKKTRRMRDMDGCLRPQFERATADIEQVRRMKDPKEGELLREIFRRETELHKLDARIRVLEEFFVSHDVAQPEVLFEARLDMQAGVGDQRQIVTVHYQETGSRLSLPIDKDVLCREIQLVSEIERSGDKEPRRSWWAEFQPVSLHHFLLHVKIYTTRCEKYRDEIEERRKEYEELQYQRQRLLGFRNEYARHRERWPQWIKDVIDEHAVKVRALRLLVNDFLTPEVFKALIDADVYIRDTVQCLKNVEKVYLEMAK